jgi:Protein of unknown function (DUF2975)
VNQSLKVEGIVAMPSLVLQNDLTYCKTIIYSYFMITKPDATDSWTKTETRAAKEAEKLHPIAYGLFIIASITIATEYLFQPIWAQSQQTPIPSFFDALRNILKQSINAGAAISLTWALWEAQQYLKRLKQGQVWAISTIKFLERIGECLIVSAVWSIAIAPTLHVWVIRHGGFDWQLESQSLILFGFGLLLDMIARVMGSVLQTAFELKTDNDGIV